jgi:hypothetical protein
VNPLVLMIVLIVVCALLLWLVPVDEFLKKLIYVILVVGVIICLLSALGVWSPPFMGGRHGTNRIDGAAITRTT